MKKILVIGATGMLGVPVVQQLVKAGFDVSALVRDIEKAKLVLPPEVKLLQGDLQQAVTVQQALKGQQGLYLNLSIRPGEREKAYHTEEEGLRSLLPLAKEAGIQRIAYLSSLVQRYQGMQGFQWWVFAVKQQAVQMIQDSGIPYTIFYPSTFMENFDKGGYVQGKRVNLAGTSAHPMFFIAGSDYGKQVARSFTLAVSANKEYIIQGPEGFTADQAARVYKQHYSRQPLRIIKAPLGLIKFMGYFNEKLNYLAHIIEALNNYPEHFEGEASWQELGKPEVKLEEYARHAR